MLHFVNDLPYEQTMCGLSTEGMKEEEYTDDTIEVSRNAKEFDACPTCVAKARKQHRMDNRDIIREIATEAGMMHGVDAYNEVMGY